MLEAFLFAAIPYKDTRDTALSLLKRYGNLKNVCDAKSDELSTEKYITNKAAVLLNSVPVFSSVFIESKTKLFATLYTPQDAISYARAVFALDPKLLFVFYVTTSNGIVYREAVRSVNMSSSYADRIVIKARQLCTRRVVCFYYGGDTIPDAEEKIATKEFSEYLDDRGIALVDMVKIGDFHTYSLKEDSVVDIGIRGRFSADPAPTKE